MIGVALLVAGLGCYLGKNFALALLVQNGQMVLVLVGRDLLGQLHTLKKELQELIVYGASIRVRISESSMMFLQQ